MGERRMGIGDVFNSLATLWISNLCWVAGYGTSYAGPHDPMQHAYPWAAPPINSHSDHGQSDPGFLHGADDWSWSPSAKRLASQLPELSEYDKSILQWLSNRQQRDEEVDRAQNRFAAGHRPMAKYGKTARQGAFPHLAPDNPGQFGYIGNPWSPGREADGQPAATAFQYHPPVYENEYKQASRTSSPTKPRTRLRLGKKIPCYNKVEAYFVEDDQDCPSDDSGQFSGELFQPQAPPMGPSDVGFAFYGGHERHGQHGSYHAYRHDEEHPDAAAEGFDDGDYDGRRQPDFRNADKGILAGSRRSTASKFPSSSETGPLVPTHRASATGDSAPALIRRKRAATKKKKKKKKPKPKPRPKPKRKPKKKAKKGKSRLYYSTSKTTYSNPSLSNSDRPRGKDDMRQIMKEMKTLVEKLDQYTGAYNGTGGKRSDDTDNWLEDK